MPKDFLFFCSRIEGIQGRFWANLVEFRVQKYFLFVHSSMVVGRVCT